MLFLPVQFIAARNIHVLYTETRVEINLSEFSAVIRWRKSNISWIRGSEKKKRERKKWTKSVCHRSVGKVEAREFFRLHDRRVVHVGNENGKSFSQQGCVCARAKVTIKGKNRLATFPFSLFSFTGETQPVERRIDRRNAFVSRRGTSRPDRSRIPRFWNGRCSVSTFQEKKTYTWIPSEGTSRRIKEEIYIGRGGMHTRNASLKSHQVPSLSLRPTEIISKSCCALLHLGKKVGKTPFSSSLFCIIATGRRFSLYFSLFASTNARSVNFVSLSTKAH